MAGLGKSGPSIRPMPEGFAEKVVELTYKQLRIFYRAGPASIKRWKDELGGAVRRGRTMPADFAAKAKVLCRADLMRHFDIGERLLERWIKETGVKPPRTYFIKPNQRKPVPDDFRDIAPTMNMRMLQEHYGVGYDPVRRWLDETGIQHAVFHNAPPRRVQYKCWSKHQIARTVRNYTPEDSAADVLREYGPVYRCDERGRQKDKGKFWRVGNVVVGGDELIARADRKRKVAA